MSFNPLSGGGKGGGSGATLITKTIDANGTYKAKNDGADAYFAWSSSQSSSRFGLRNDVTIHYDWDPNAED